MILEYSNLGHLFSEDYSSIQERWDQVVNQQVNLCSIVLLKVFIHLQPLHHTTGQHTVGLPPLIILRQEPQLVTKTCQHRQMHLQDEYTHIQHMPVYADTQF